MIAVSRRRLSMVRVHALFLALIAVLMFGVACKSEEKPAASIGKTAIAKFEIVDMATENCPVLVKTAVGKMEGIKSVEASNETKSATVEYYEAVTNPQEILKVIQEQAGFNAKIIGS
jgi:copper chaperone CopZ